MNANDSPRSVRAIKNRRRGMATAWTTTQALRGAGGDGGAPAVAPLLRRRAIHHRDIALCAYTHVAPEGGFDLLPYPSVRRWLDAVPATPDYIPIMQG